MLKAVAASGSGAAGGITIGTSVITGGTNTRVLFDDNGVIGENAGLTFTKGTGTLGATIGNFATSVTIGAGSAITSSGSGGVLGSNAFNSTAYLPLSGGTLTGSLTISGASLITSGSISAAAWTTSGLRAIMNAASYTDTSSSGTVANAYTDLFGASTILASSATTYTNYYGAYFKAPVASTNVTMTNKFAIGADSIALGPLSGAYGSAAAPPFSVGAANNGIYASSANILDFSAGGTQTLRISASGFFVPVSTGFFELSSGGTFYIGNGTAGSDTKDTSLSRVSAGLWQMGTTANNASGSLNLTNLTATGTILGGAVTVGAGLALKLGNAAVTGLTPGALAALTTATIAISDSTGTVYRVPAITP